ncbi:response regulator [Candidatus Micrarchaeota archaeon]|nr:response regulator [Candidatus Micrarchaeota archaeon]
MILMAVMKCPGTVPAKKESSRGKEFGKAPRQSGRMATVLVVDDEPNIIKSIQRLLGPLGIAFESAGNGLEALELYRKSPADIVITDLNMPVMDGFDLLKQIKKEAPDSVVIIHSGGVNSMMKELLISEGADRVIEKGDSHQEIRNALSGLIQES